ERMYAAGKIPGGFFKREGRPTERAILTARMIDRPIRPLWPKGFRNEVQVICTVLSADLVTPHDVLCINGASAALMISPLPFYGPVGAVRMGMVDGELVVNPTLKESEEESTLDLIVVGTKDALTMVEAGADEIPEDTLLEALARAHRCRAGLQGAEVREAEPALRSHPRERRSFFPGQQRLGRGRDRGQGRNDEAVRQAGCGGDLQGPRPQEDRRRQAATGRPRSGGDPADRVRGRRLAAHPRL